MSRGLSQRGKREMREKKEEDVAGGLEGEGVGVGSAKM